MLATITYYIWVGPWTTTPTDQEVINGTGATHSDTEIKSAGSRFTTLATGLTEGQQYRMAAYAITEDGDEMRMVDRSFFTEEPSSGAPWPGSVPAPIISDYAISDSYYHNRLQMSAGPDRVLRRTSQFYSEGQASVVVDAAGAADFRTLLENIRNGVDFIEAPIDTGEGAETKLIRISGVTWTTANYKPGDNWKISFKFETEVS